MQLMVGVNDVDTFAGIAGQADRVGQVPVGGPGLVNGHDAVGWPDGVPCPIDCCGFLGMRRAVFGPPVVSSPVQYRLFIYCTLFRRYTYTRLGQCYHRSGLDYFSWDLGAMPGQRGGTSIEAKYKERHLSNAAKQSC